MELNIYVYKEGSYKMCMLRSLETTDYISKLMYPNYSKWIHVWMKKYVIILFAETMHDLT